MYEFRIRLFDDLGRHCGGSTVWSRNGLCAAETEYSGDSEGHTRIILVITPDGATGSLEQMVPRGGCVEIGPRKYE